MGLLRAGRFLVRQRIKRNTEYPKRASSGKDLEAGPRVSAPSKVLKSSIA